MTTPATLEYLAEEIASATGADKNEVFLWLANGDAQNLTATDLQDLINEWKSY